MVKIVMLAERGRGLKTFTYFEKFIAENGNYICAIDDEVVDRDEGNAIYKEMKARGAVCVLNETGDRNDEEILSYIEAGIDHYAAYIDNYKQYREVEERNAKLRKLASAFRQVAER